MHWHNRITLGFRNLLLSFLHNLKENHVQLLWIIVVNLIVYGKVLFNPYLFSDDWWLTYLGATDQLTCPTPDFFRPLLFCWPAFVHGIFGVNPAAFHFMNLLTISGVVILLYFILIYFFPDNNILVTICVILFSVIPANLSHTWYTISGIRFTFLLFFLSVIFLISFLRTKNWMYYIVSVLILFLTFSIYEYHLGLAFIVPWLIFIKEKPTQKAIRLALGGVALIPILFALWRAFGQTTVGITDAGVYTVDASNLSIPDIIQRLIIGYRVHFQWSWTEVILHLPFFKNLPEPRNIYATLIFVSWVLLFIIFAWAIQKVTFARFSVKTDRNLMIDIRTPVIGLGIGFILVGFGYFPIVTIWIPWMGFDISRMNILPGIGSALVIVCIIQLIALVIHRGRQGAHLSIVLISIPLILLGVTAQLMVNQGAELASFEQKKVWSQLFELAPGLAPHTSLYLILQPREEPDIFQPRPFPDGNWGMGFSSALAFFYSDDTLRGVAIHQIPQPPKFGTIGIERPWGIDSYRQIILLKYDRLQERLAILNEFPSEIMDGETPAGYNPRNLIDMATDREELARRDLIK